MIPSATSPTLRTLAQYAATLEGSAITLLKDALWSSMGLPTGTYTLDLNGRPSPAPTI